MSDEFERRVEQLAKTLKAQGIATSEARARDMASDIVRTEMRQQEKLEQRSKDPSFNPQQRTGEGRQSDQRAAQLIADAHGIDPDRPISELLEDADDAQARAEQPIQADDTPAFNEEPEQDVTDDTPTITEEPEQDLTPETLTFNEPEQETHDIPVTKEPEQDASNNTPAFNEEPEEDETLAFNEPQQETDDTPATKEQEAPERFSIGEDEEEPEQEDDSSVVEESPEASFRSADDLLNDGPAPQESTQQAPEQTPAGSQRAAEELFMGSAPAEEPEESNPEEPDSNLKEEPESSSKEEPERPAQPKVDLSEMFNFSKRQ